MSDGHKDCMKCLKCNTRAYALMLCDSHLREDKEKSRLWDTLWQPEYLEVELKRGGKR